ARSLTTEDVVNALKGQSQQVTAGQLGMPPAPNTQAFQYTLDIAGRFDDVSQFENIVVKTESNGQMVYVRDVGRVELGAQTYSQVFTLNGKPSAGIGIFQTLEANALDVAGGVAAKMKELAKSFPPGLTYTIPFDTTTFVRASINEVWKTLFEAAILVLLVIVVFLQDWRAMLVPMTTVPVTIIGAFAAMAALGFTINLSTLFAIVLAIGIVVDDAIVVVEGAAHHIERGLPRKEAAIQAMNELFGPIIGITLVLMSCSRIGASAARARTCGRCSSSSTALSPPSPKRASWCSRRRPSRESATPAGSPCSSSCATEASISPSCRRPPIPWSRMRKRKPDCSG